MQATAQPKQLIREGIEQASVIDWTTIVGSPPDQQLAMASACAAWWSLRVS